MNITRPSLAIFAVSSLLVLSACQPQRPAAAPVPTPEAPPANRIVPLPASLTTLAGPGFVIDSTTAIAVAGTNPELSRTAEMLASILRPSTGFPVPVTQVTTPGARQIVLRLAAQPAGSAEGYELRVTPNGVDISASQPAGVFRGTQTLRQLLPAAIESHMRIDGVAWMIPAVAIADRPRFEWRGAMLDVARHFFTPKEVKQYIDILALYKLNVFHVHLSDDQGWRIEIKSRPTLATVGGATQVGGGPGGFFTQQEYADIVRYAQERYITIVPEIDMPAHTNAALVAFPHLSCGKRPAALYTGTEVGFSAFCVEKEETYALIDDIIREIAAMTPGPYFHVGGDEVEALTPAQYNAFIERVQGIVRRHGKRLVGWEEINKAKLDSTSLVQQWIGDTLTPQPGPRLIVSPSKRMYIDMKYDEATELGLKWAGLVEVRTAYDWDPAAYNPNTPESRIAGIEAPMWSEKRRNITAVEYLAMPRLPAVAEVGWTAQSRRDWESFRHRLAAQARRWNYLGINYYRSPQIPW